MWKLLLCSTIVLFGSSLALANEDGYVREKHLSEEYSLCMKQARKNNHLDSIDCLMKEKDLQWKKIKANQEAAKIALAKKMDKSQINSQEKKRVALDCLEKEINSWYEYAYNADNLNMMINSDEGSKGRLDNARFNMELAAALAWRLERIAQPGN